jgi:mRNA interferase MazF
MTRPQSGEVYLADLDPVRGSEQGLKRPVLILQNPDLSRYTSTYLAIPLTTNLDRLGWPGTCSIRKGEGGLPQESVALAFQMRALDASRLGKLYGRVSLAALNSIADAVLKAVGIGFSK